MDDNQPERNPYDFYPRPHWRLNWAKRLLEQMEAKLPHYQEVAARHEPGTSYHTRATRSIEGLEGRIAIVKAWIAEQESKGEITEAARALGSVKSDRKAEAARANGRLGGRPPKK